MKVVEVGGFLAASRFHAMVTEIMSFADDPAHGASTQSTPVEEAQVAKVEIEADASRALLAKTLVCKWLTEHPWAKISIAG